MIEMYAVANLFITIIILVILFLVMDGLIQIGLWLVQTVREVLGGLF